MLSKSRPVHFCGYSLIEFIICIAILGILFSISLPTFSSWLNQSHVEKIQKSYVRIINFSREIAINKNVTVTLCKSDDGLECKGQWADGSIAFIDYNRNAQLDEEDQVLNRISPDKYISLIFWRSFRNKPYLQITPLGFTNNQSGNFTFCAKDNDLKQARQIIINRVGRIRLAQDSDNDGYREDSKGRQLRC